jgi:hypothetical protein
MRTMISRLLENAEYWHSRAVEARAIAEALPDEAAKNLMLGIAKDYERMAERAASRRTTRMLDAVVKHSPQSQLSRPCLSEDS